MTPSRTEPLLAKALESAAKEGATAAGRWIAAAAGLGAAGEPAGALAGAALQALAAALLEQAALEEKLDHLLQEPWSTGSRELLEALRLPAARKSERGLREARLRGALARLDSAATHAAQADDGQLGLLIAALQALGYAALEGGGPSASRKLAPLKSRARALRAEAAEAERRSRLPETLHRAPRLDAMTRLGQLREGPRRRFDDEPGKSRALELTDEASRLRAGAVALERFARLVEAATRRPPLPRSGRGKG